MPKVKVQSKSKFEAQETFEKLKVFFEEDEGLRKLDADYVCKFDDAKLSGSAKGSKFDATLKVDGSTVTVLVEIPFVLTPFKGMVQETLERKLDKLLG